MPDNKNDRGTLPGPRSAQDKQVYTDDRMPEEAARPAPARPLQSELWRESLELVERQVPFRRVLVRSKGYVYRYHTPFERLYLAHSGYYKVMSLTADGREKPSGLKFKGDWLGLDGIASGRHDNAAVALETGEVWSVRYDELLRAASREPRLMHLVLAACANQLARNREATLSVTSLPADARVAEFLLHWAQSLLERDMQAEPVSMYLPLARADMGAYLGLRLESVSRSLAGCRSRADRHLLTQAARDAHPRPGLAGRLRAQPSGT